MTKREQLIAWLEDAHAMEVGIVSTLEKHIADAKGQPEVVSALRTHLAETKKHATAMKQALGSLGGSHPIIREGISKVVNMVTGLGTSMAVDTPVKNAITDFATEHFEIACYTSLVQTATEIGETKVAQTCKAILREEEAMAKRLKALFPQINAAYLRTLEDEDSRGSEADFSSPKPKRSSQKSQARPASKTPPTKKVAAAKKAPTARKTPSKRGKS